MEEKYVYYYVIQRVPLFREMAESHAPGGDVTFTTEGEPVKAAGRFRTVLPQVRMG
jgi:hypothetical protein